MNPVPSSGAPRVYLMPYRAAWVLISVALAATPLCMVLSDPSWTQGKSTVEIYLHAAFGLLASCLGLGFLGETLHYRFILATDYIEQRQLFKMRRVEFSQLAGFRESDQTAYDLVLQLRDRSSIRITQYFRTDAALQAWLDRLPDLDHADHLARIREVNDNTALGATPAERTATNDRSWKVAKWLTGFCMGLCLVGLLYPRPYPLVMGLAMGMPLLALALRWRQPERYALCFHNRDARANLIAVLLFPVALLQQRAWLDFHLVTWIPLAVPALVGGALLFALSGMKAKPSWAALAVAGAMAVYSAAAAVLLNAAFDQLPATRTELTVVDKARANGRSGNRILSLKAAPSAPLKKVAATSAEYNQFDIGDRACLTQHPGRFGIAWYAVETCPEAR